MGKPRDLGHTENSMHLVELPLPLSLSPSFMLLFIRSHFCTQSQLLLARSFAGLDRKAILWNCKKTQRVKSAAKSRFVKHVKSFFNVTKTNLWGSNGYLPFQWAFYMMTPDFSNSDHNLPVCKKMCSFFLVFRYFSFLVMSFKSLFRPKFCV